MNRTLLLVATLALAAGLGALALLVRGGESAALEREERREPAPSAERGTAELFEPAPRDPTGEDGALPAGDVDQAVDAAAPRPARRAVAGTPATSIRFHLEDDLGQPIREATFTFGRGAEREAKRLQGTQGEFVLAGLEPGPWLIRAAVEGHSERPSGSGGHYALPHDGPPVRLVFERNGSVAGRVVDLAGGAVPGINVSLSSLVEGRRWSRSGDADENGAFQFPDAAPGPLVASASNGFVDVSVELVLAPGQVLEGIEIRVAGGGYVRGRVLDRESRPVAGMDVVIVDRLDFRSSVETDEQGEFRLGPITPGSYQVFAVLKQRERSDSFEQLLSREVSVAEGEVVDVVLQPSQTSPVRLHGRVTLGGEPLGGCTVYAFREDAGLLDTVRMERSNDQGVYSMELDRAGAFLFLFEPRDNPSNSPVAPLRALVPEVAEHRLDLALPVGSIAGRVLDVEGEGQSGTRVVAEREDGYLDLRLPDSRRGVRADGDGSYAVRYLTPGTYTLRVEGGLAWATRVGVEVREGESVTGVDLRATAGGGVRGVVRSADGQPVQGAAVYLRDGAGRLLGARPAVTDGEGHFQREAVPPGPVSASARATEGACAESGAKEVKSGAWVVFDLRLERASLLTASAVDDSGRPVSCAIRVHDAAGLDVTNTSSPERAAGNFADPLSSSRRTVGPLPAGRYEVTATRPDGSRARRTVRLASGRDEAVELRFD